MKLEYEGPIYDDFGFEALKGGILNCRLDCAIPEKKKKEKKQGGWEYTFWKNPQNFLSFYFTLGNSGQNKA